MRETECDRPESTRDGPIDNRLASSAASLSLTDQADRAHNGAVQGPMPIDHPYDLIGMVASRITVQRSRPSSRRSLSAAR